MRNWEQDRGLFPKLHDNKCVLTQRTEWQEDGYNDFSEWKGHEGEPMEVRVCYRNNDSSDVLLQVVFFSSRSILINF